MRKKIVAQRSIFDQSIRTLTALVKPDQELKRIDAVITRNPKIIDLVHPGHGPVKSLRCASIFSIHNTIPWPYWERAVSTGRSN